MVIDFCIHEDPIPLKRHKAVRRGNFIKMYDPSCKDKKQFCALAIEHAPEEPIAEAIALSLVFTIKRPKSHYRAGKYSDILRDDAPIVHISKPDIDNLVKFVLDALNGAFWKDDTFVNEISASKWYGKTGSTAARIEC